MHKLDSEDELDGDSEESEEELLVPGLQVPSMSGHFLPCLDFSGRSVKRCVPTKRLGW